MTKVDKEQAKALERPSGWQCIKKWLMNHKIETAAILVCLLGAGAILAIVYVPRAGNSSGAAAPSSTPATNADNNGNGDSTPNNGDVGSPDVPSEGAGEDGDGGDVPPPDSDSVMDSAIFQQLSLLTNMQDTTSPQYKAADWLIALDFMKLGANSPNLQQRFALATFYLATGGGLASREGWRRCSSVPPAVENDNTEAASNMQCIVRDGKVICAEKSNFETCAYTDEFGTVQQGKRFLSAVNECEWFGVTCDDNGVVIKIDIENNALGGYLPPEIALLTGLTRLNLSNNTIGGSIPEELSLIDGMAELLLTSNKLQGTIPRDVYDLQQLRRFEVERNNLEGPLLPEVGNLQILQVLYANHNKLTGTLPSELGTLSGLRKATFNQNKMSGPIPSELGNLVNLQSIKFANNSFTGAVPSGLCDIDVPISADCLENPDTGVIEVTCSCCSRCCADGERCQDN